MLKPVERNVRVISSIHQLRLKSSPSVVRMRYRKTIAAIIIQVLATANIVFAAISLWMVPIETDIIIDQMFPIPRNIPTRRGDPTIKPKKKTVVR